MSFGFSGIYVIFNSTLYQFRKSAPLFLGNLIEMILVQEISVMVLNSLGLSLKLAEFYIYISLPINLIFFLMYLSSVLLLSYLIKRKKQKSE
jgi:hypothetical protein